MPDISNEDLMKLVYRVINKVDTLEEKLDEVLFVLKGKRKRPKVQMEDFPEIDYNFDFTPIGNAEELEHVSQRIEQDEGYRKNLVCL